ncbi:hypothetical protein EJ05DRAFT_511906 [Pseudovirgaria hyperparasitica]|uniref:Zn(2)-C6 fungal-type domain-containing protein n=1 Tax=Pseudovirgaria hyperparasitica TaxID=470096 RepID=A0A6A6W2M0_9PEZI|nr:uncharacterized protein EJ05DRAFT_511906 [Pseudovirgaria hyperparasitica]KAF2757178.1 hypothetical protein EJ05DRAFT_511906 [Pseudovirgaria hyperparasitica]
MSVRYVKKPREMDGSAPASASGQSANNVDAAGMAANPASGPPTRVDKACVRCRRKKMSCRPSSEESNRCQRCVRSNEECVFPETTERPKKRRLLNSRVGALEQNMEGIMTLLANAQAANAKHDGDEPAPSRQIHGSANPPLPPVRDHPYPAPTTPSCRPDMIDKLLLSEQAALKLLDKYKDMSVRFPYVLLPPNVTLAELRETSPLLLRSMFVAATCSTSPSQDPLEREYLYTLTVHAVVDGQKSFDALQSLMVYLSWCHWHVKPDRQSLYRLASIAVGMCLDLGLNRKPQVTEAQEMNVETHWAKQPALAPQNNELWSPEARRIVLGLYNLTATWAVLRRKAPLMNYSAYYSTCAQSLADEKHARTDPEIVMRLEIVRMLSTVAEEYGYYDQYQSPILSDENLELYTASLMTRLDQWKSFLPPDPKTGVPKLTFEYYLFQAYAREIAVHFPSKLHELSINRARMLSECLKYCGESLDHILATPPSALVDFTTTQWCGAIYVIILASKVATCHHSPSYNIGTTRNIIRLERYLDLITTKLEEVNKVSTPTGAHVFWWQHLLRIMDSIKAQYLHAVAQHEEAMSAVQRQQQQQQQQQQHNHQHHQQQQLDHAQRHTYDRMPYNPVQAVQNHPPHPEDDPRMQHMSALQYSIPTTTAPVFQTLGNYTYSTQGGISGGWVPPAGANEYISWEMGNSFLGAL